jgi:hypothetical protein
MTISFINEKRPGVRGAPAGLILVFAALAAIFAGSGASADRPGPLFDRQESADGAAFRAEAPMSGPDAQEAPVYRAPVIERIKASHEKLKKWLSEFSDNFFTVDKIVSYIILVLTFMFIYYFLLENSAHYLICIFVPFIYIIFIYLYAFKDFKCDIYKYLEVFLIAPTLFCIDQIINRYRYFAAPLAILPLAVVFSYHLELGLAICAVFVLIDFGFVLKFVLKHKKTPDFKPYVKQILTLAVLSAVGYVVSLHLDKQFYFKAFKFFTS